MAGPITWDSHNKICQILFVAGSTIVNCCYIDFDFGMDTFFMKLVYTNFNLPSDTISHRQCQLMVLPGGIFAQCLFSLLQDLILLLQQVHNLGCHVSVNRCLSLLSIQSR